MIPETVRRSPSAPAAGGQLTEAVRRKPYCVILFDEVEKAHADVFNILLQVLDDGRITDSQGRVVSFKNALIIMTSNLGSQFLLEDSDAAREAVMEVVRGHFKPEFINRIDEFVLFDALKKDQIKRIVRLQAARVADRLREKRMGFELRDSAADWLADKGFDPVYGARPVKRAVQRELETVLAKAMLRGEFVANDTVVVEADDRGLVLTKGLPLEADAAERRSQGGAASVAA